MQHLHLGELLVKHGVISGAQRDEVLTAQRSRGGAFGALAEEMFGVSPGLVEQAWATQYAAMAPLVDPRGMAISGEALGVVSRRQAWQFRLLPLEMRSGGGGLVACTTQDGLVRALRFAGWRLGYSCHLVLAKPEHLGEALCTHYPLAGMTARSVLSNEVARLSEAGA